MQIAAVELHTAQEVRDHAAQVTARIIQARRPSLSIEAIKAERDQYRALVEQLQEKNKVLLTQLSEATGENFLIAPPDEAGAVKITVERVIRAAAAHFSLDRADILSHRRTKNVVIPRQTAMYLCKQLTDRSLPDIGRRFAGRDHTTVLHAIRRTEARLACEPGMQSHIDAITKVVIGQRG